MDPPTVVKTFKYNPSQQQQQQQHIFNNVLEQTPLHFRSFSLNKNSTFQGISFSSYLKPKENDDTEINIFDAQKYFCENNDPKLIKTQQQKREPSSHEILPRLSSVSSGDGYGRNFRTRSFHGTPTASSEASWNSQTGLLVNLPGSSGVSMKKISPDDNTKKIKRRNYSSVAKKWIFGRKCCCAGKKSVRVKEVTTSDSDHCNGKPNNLYAKSDSHKAKSLSSMSQRSSITSDHIMEIPQNKILPQNLSSPEKDHGNGKPNNLYAKSDSHKAKSLSSMSKRSSITSYHIMEIPQNKILPQNLSSPENDFPSTDLPRQQRISASGRSFVDGTGGFSFPILKNPTQAVKPGPKGIISKSIISPLEEDTPRDSLEVFQPMDNPVNARHRFNPGSPIACVASTDDDLGSDASSDLFEIESFSTPTTSYPMYRRRDSLDEAPMLNARKFASANGINDNNNIQYGRRSLDEPPTPSLAATECYGPSEVSIDWSVTTAEGFDRDSISNFSVSASEIGGAAFSGQRMQEEAGSGGGDGGKRQENGGGLLMMSCKQENAVSVGPQPVKYLPATATEGGRGPPVFAMHVGGRPPRANKTTTLGNDHTARVSLPFAA